MSDYGIVTWLDRKKMRERSEIHYRPPYLNALCDLYIVNEQTAIILLLFCNGGEYEESQRDSMINVIL